MGKKTKNPFAILGITPLIVARMDNKALYKMVKACYRVLQLAHHPDQRQTESEVNRRKSTEQAANINLAYEQLDWEKNPESFLRHKERYIAAPKRDNKKAAKIQDALQLLIERQGQMSNSFWQYLPQSRGKDPQAAAPVLSCLDSLRDVTLGLIDIALKQNLRSGSWTKGTGYKELRFDETGQMHRRLPCRKSFAAVNYVKLIGTIQKDRIDIEALLEKKPLKGAMYIPNHSPATRTRSLRHVEVMNSILLPEFKWHCLPFLCPDILEGRYLFSIHTNVDGRDKVFVEGIISRITRNQEQGHP